jgi:NTP pyrophosphatase (non-canonical NTP hydrolase)
MDYKQLISECHQTAVEHGWWDEPRAEDELICLFHSEVSEAFEEYRAHKPLDLVYYKDDNPKPEGIPVELADLLVRIFDLLGDIYKDNPGLLYSFVERPLIKKTILAPIPPTFSALCKELHKKISNLAVFNAYFLMMIVKVVDGYCMVNGIKLEEALRLKMDYNKTRPYRHGKKI